MNDFGMNVNEKTAPAKEAVYQEPDFTLIRLSDTDVIETSIDLPIDEF